MSVTLLTRVSASLESGATADVFSGAVVTMQSGAGAYVRSGGLATMCGCILVAPARP